MKKILTTLIALGAAGLLFPAVAQPAPENNNSAPAAEQPAPPPTEAGNAAPPADAAATPPDAGALPVPPPEVIAALAAQEAGGADDNAQKPSGTIQPTKPLGAETPKIQATFTALSASDDAHSTGVASTRLFR